MSKIENRYAKLTLFLVILMLMSAVLPAATAEGSIKGNRTGFDKGLSYTNVVPLKKTAMVQFDKDSLLDDYAYLAAVPTAVFKQNNKLFSHPLLFYEDEYKPKETRDRTFNPRQGLDYFMEDWMSYCNGKLDEMTAINIPQNKLEQWNARKYTIISSDSPFEIAKELALHDWSHSDNAVIAVIKERYENPAIKTSGEIKGTIKPCQIQEEHFKIPRPTIGLGAAYKTFQITDHKYKYVLAQMKWKEKEDYDLQIYDPELGMVRASAGAFNSPYPYSELVGSYISNYGDWELSISAIQKKSTSSRKGKMESMCFYAIPQSIGLSALLNNTLDVNVVLLPGVDIPIDEIIPFGCRNVEFTLKPSDPNVDLGFAVIDPVGTEIASSFSLGEVAKKVLNLKETSKDKDSEIKINLEKLGETSKDEKYSVCVFSVGNLYHDVDFTIEYSWSQNFTREEGNQIESACNGAVLASTLNAPLLYTKADTLNNEVKDVLYKLGVKNVYIADIGNYLSSKAEEELKEIADIKQKFTTSLDVYNVIRKNTGANDVIFTTIEPYDYWYVANDLEGYGREPAGQWDGAYHFAQTSYLAAHHGSPVIIVDNHPKLSQATTWATDWWRVYANDRTVEPSAGAMTLTARRAYEFLEENGFGKIEAGGPEKQKQEVIITVAGQFDIGVPWDRCFTGAGLNGRFWGHPVDSAYLICRNVFYPALIFVNPAMHEVTLWQGSESKTQTIGGRLRKPYGSTLVITKPTREEKFKYPVLESFVTYGFRYNEEKWKHFNCRYTRADGVIPWVTSSPDPIDDGAAHGKTGAYYPDMSESEVIPFYCNKAGYSNVFSTNFDYITENLNRGVIMWFSQIHGHHFLGGSLELWSPESPYVYEENPWRTYEPIALKPGHLDEFIRWLGYHGYHSFLNGLGMDVKPLEILGKIPTRPLELFPEYGSTENPDVGFINYQLTTLGKIVKPLSAQLGVFDAWGPWPFMIYRSRVLHPIKTLRQHLPFINWGGASKLKGDWILSGDGKVCVSPPTGGRLVGKLYFGPDFDDALKNMHSVGINSISCFPAFTCMHLTWMRHGAVYIIMDPWTTTDWAGIWNQMIPKKLAMGYTVGQAYERSLRAVGPEYSCGQSWWDVWENIVYTGDPNLRVFVPNTEYTDYRNGYEENHWKQKDTLPLSYDKETNINGHTPFGATSYPHEKQPPVKIPTWIILLILLIILVIAIAIATGRGRVKRKAGETKRKK